jgi:hypothetical protein
MSVGAAQFELPWDAFKLDAENNAEDEYKAFDAFNKTYNELPLLSDALKSSVIVFGNKEVKSYEFKNRVWPLVITICSIIDTFHTHPSYGIESILAIRIRHDNLRREFAIAIANAKKTTLLDVSFTDAQRTTTFARIEGSIYVALQNWIDAYMHTKKGEDGSGIFNFIPTQAEMAALVGDLAGEPTLSEIVGNVTNWISGRLDDNLSTARMRLSVDLRSLLRSAGSRTTSDLVKEHLPKSGVMSVVALVETDVFRRIDELSSWFQMPRTKRVVGLSYDEMKLAVEGRFHEEVVAGQLMMAAYFPHWSERIISPDDLRSMFDLWSELTLNAMKYGRKPTTRMRISEFEDKSSRGLRFSTLCDPDGKSESVLVGTPNLLHEPMLKAGKSGLKIVAALSATLVGQTVNLHAVRGARGFHVFVPLEGAN